MYARIRFDLIFLPYFDA